MTRSEALAALGLGPEPSAEEMTAAFRRLAKESHPDLRPGDREADGRFKRYREAHDILAGKAVATAPPVPVQPAQPRRGADVATTVTITLAQAAAGGPVALPVTAGDACASCRGSGRSEPALHAICGVCHGEGVVVKARGILRVKADCVTCKGTGIVVRGGCRACGGTGQAGRLPGGAVHLPQGVEDGQVLAFPARGGLGAAGGGAGDLSVTVRIAPHPFFIRRGDDLLARHACSFADLCLGGGIEIPALAGGRLKVRIPPGTQAGAVLSLRGQGMPHGGGRGRLLLRLDPVVPSKLSAEQRGLLERWRRTESLERA